MCARNCYHIGVCFKSEGLLPSLERALYSQNSPVLSEYKTLYSHCLHKANKHGFSPFALNTFCYTSYSQALTFSKGLNMPVLFACAKHRIRRSRLQESAVQGTLDVSSMLLLSLTNTPELYPLSHYQEKPIP